MSPAFGEIDKSDSCTLYAGMLDDPSALPSDIFAEGRPPWAIIPPGVRPDAGLICLPESILSKLGVRLGDEDQNQKD
jgi:hypothetical protein